MKFCPVVPEICRGQVHGPRKERRKIIRIIIIKIIIRNGAKTTLFGRLNNNISAFLNSCNKVPVKECSEEAPKLTGEFFLLWFCNEIV